MVTCSINHQKQNPRDMPIDGLLLKHFICHWDVLGLLWGFQLPCGVVGSPMVGFCWWWLVSGLSPFAFVGVCCFCISLSTAGQALVGVGCLFAWWFSVCSSWFLECGGCAWGFDWWDSFSVDTDVFQCGWCGHYGSLRGKRGIS